MITVLPGTKIECNITDSAEAKNLLDNIFCSGGLVLSQVSNLIGIEPYAVQNWIKRGFCTSPVNKKYSMRQFCRLVTINMLKDSLSIPDIVSLLSYINGHLDDESDDMIDDADLYIYFISVILLLEGNTLTDDICENAVKTMLSDYEEAIEGTKIRLQRVLRVMAVSYFSATLKAKAAYLISLLD